MKTFAISLLFSSVLGAPSSLDELHKKSKKFWTEQFHPWEKSGISKQMIQGAKTLYWSEDFVYEMTNKNLKRNQDKWGLDEIQM